MNRRGIHPAAVVAQRYLDHRLTIHVRLQLERQVTSVVNGRFGYKGSRTQVGAVHQCLVERQHLAGFICCTRPDSRCPIADDLCSGVLVDRNVGAGRKLRCIVHRRYRHRDGRGVLMWCWCGLILHDVRERNLSVEVLRWRKVHIVVLNGNRCRSDRVHRAETVRVQGRNADPAGGRVHRVAIQHVQGVGARILAQRKRIVIRSDGLADDNGDWVLVIEEIVRQRPIVQALHKTDLIVVYCELVVRVVASWIGDHQCIINGAIGRCTIQFQRSPSDSQHVYGE